MLLHQISDRVSGLVGFWMLFVVTANSDSGGGVIRVGVDLLLHQFDERFGCFILSGWVLLLLIIGEWIYRVRLGVGIYCYINSESEYSKAGIDWLDCW